MSSTGTQSAQSTTPRSKSENEKRALGCLSVGRGNQGPFVVLGRYEW